MTAGGVRQLDGAAHELGVGLGELAPAEIDVVLEADPDFPTEGECRERQLQLLR